MSAHWAWFSPEYPIDTGRLCSAGFRRSPRSPTSTLLCSPPTPCLRRPRLRFPLPVAYLDASACSVPCGRRHVRSPNVSCVGDGSPALRKTGMSRGEARASRCLGRLFVRAMVEHPAGYGPLLAHRTERLLWPSGNSAPWASGKMIGFGAACPMARTFAYLRIAEAISGTVARLATGPAGSPLAGRVSHPLDDTQSFMKVSPPPIPFDQPCLVALKILSIYEQLIGH